jgi:ATP-dependent protease ClpP protease subunit
MARKRAAQPVEIVAVGEVDDWEQDAVKSLLEVPTGGEVVFYIDSAGGSVYSALALVTLLRQRRLRGTAVVLGECSSATLLLFAACPRRLVTRYSTLLFHRMRWQSEKDVISNEAVNWARHFEQLEGDLDELQVQLFGAAAPQVRTWTADGRYVSGPEVAEAGLAELFEIAGPPGASTQNTS